MVGTNLGEEAETENRRTRESREVIMISLTEAALLLFYHFSLLLAAANDLVVVSSKINNN